MNAICSEVQNLYDNIPVEAMEINFKKMPQVNSNPDQLMELKKAMMDVSDENFDIEKLDWAIEKMEGRLTKSR